jgi:phosphate transport system permease protein
MTTREGKKKATGADLSARGEPFLWGMGGALALGLAMILGFLVLVVWNGISTFYPKPVEVVHLKDGTLVAGEPTRSERYRVPKHELEGMDKESRAAVMEDGGYGHRTLYRTGNFDLYNEDFVWVSSHNIREVQRPAPMLFIERVEWGPFIGTVKTLVLRDKTIEAKDKVLDVLHTEHRKAVERRKRIRHLERNEIGVVNRGIEKERLALRRAALKHGKGSDEYDRVKARSEARVLSLENQYGLLKREAEDIKNEDRQFKVILQDVRSTKKELLLSHIVRFYPANDLTALQKLGIYFSRWLEFLTHEPREANTEGGVMPAIFGTFVMTVLLALAVAPFGVMAALYLREYAKQGRLVSLVRISVNNLAGVPSIVYGVFGLGFFAYIIGGSIDQIFFPERLPSPTFGSGGVLWASLTLALLTVPVVIVSTEEALAAVPQSMREGSLACGASKWQTIRNIVLPKAMPGIMTGLILAMARGAGEVAPLMLVGVVKLAPELPIDRFFPFIHLERSFMHLGFHIFDVGFQSRNSEAGKPMVFVTTLLLIGLVAAMNATAIYIRNRLKRKYYVGHF